MSFEKDRWDSSARSLNKAVPRTFDQMFRFNMAVMNVQKHEWMYEAIHQLAQHSIESSDACSGQQRDAEQSLAKGARLLRHDGSQHLPVSKVAGQGVHPAAPGGSSGYKMASAAAIILTRFLPFSCLMTGFRLSCLALLPSHLNIYSESARYKSEVVKPTIRNHDASGKPDVAAIDVRNPCGVFT